MKSGWYKEIQELHRNYYLPIVYILSVIIALILILLFHRRNKFGKLFAAYLTFDFIIFILDEYVANFSTMSGKTADLFVSITNAFISFFELILYIYFFKKILVNKKVKAFISAGQWIFILIFLTYVANLFHAIKFTPWIKFSNLVTATELSLLLIPCFSFYFELLTKDSTEILVQRPTFWISTGVFVFSALSIPYYSLIYYLMKYDHEAFFKIAPVLFFIPLTLNYIFLSIAFLCKKPLTA
jgi:hypothetical protein